MFLLITTVLGLLAGYFGIALALAQTIATLFLNFLSMIAAPIVGLSIFSTLLNMEDLSEMKTMGKRVLGYTLLTTLLATLVALGLFLWIQPVAIVEGNASSETTASYLRFVTDIVPSNIFKALLENKVISIAFLGFLFGITSHYLPKEDKEALQKVFSACFKLFLKIAGLAAKVMPIAVFAFVAILVTELKDQEEMGSLWHYLAVVITANLVQGLVVIPLLLKMKGISPIKTARGSYKALLLAFFTKSSNATLPMSLKVAQENLKVRPRIAHFVLPLCTVINMNGCAAFILTTVLFVAGSNGYVFTPIDLAFWVLMSVLAAVGNAGVPMGCFFLSSAFLVGLGVPLTLMGLILPFYALIDMEETALNVWSDLSVAAMVEKDT